MPYKILFSLLFSATLMAQSWDSKFSRAPKGDQSRTGDQSLTCFSKGTGLGPARSAENNFDGEVGHTDIRENGSTNVKEVNGPNVAHLANKAINGVFEAGAAQAPSSIVVYYKGGRGGSYEVQGVSVFRSTDIVNSRAEIYDCKEGFCVDLTTDDGFVHTYVCGSNP